MPTETIIKPFHSIMGGSHEGLNSMRNISIFHIDLGVILILVLRKKYRILVAILKSCSEVMEASTTAKIKELNQQCSKLHQQNLV